MAVIADKLLHKGMLFGHISNGGGSVDLGNGKELKFTAVNDKFVKLQIIEHGIGVEVATQKWQKTKIIEKPKKEPEVMKSSREEDEYL